MSARVRSGSRRTNRRGGHGFILALAMGTSLAVLAATLALVLRWPGPSSAPDAPSLPISVGGLVFNVPPAAIRLPLQRRAGAQGRLDLVFSWHAAAGRARDPRPVSACWNGGSRRRPTSRCGFRATGWSIGGGSPPGSIG